MSDNIQTFENGLSIDHDKLKTKATTTEPQPDPETDGITFTDSTLHDPNEATPQKNNDWITKDFDAGRAWDLAWELNNTGSAIGRAAFEATYYDDDPDFDLEEHFDDLAEDIPKDHWDRLSEARSLKHAEFIKNRIHEETGMQKELLKMGKGTFIGSTILQGVTDPGAIGLSIATGGLSTIAKARRLSAGIKAGLITGAENMALEAILMQSNKTADYSDFLWAGAAGFALGGTYGAVRARPGSAIEEVRPELHQASQRHLYEIEDANLREAKGETADDIPDTELMKEIKENDRLSIEAEDQAELDVSYKHAGAAEAEFQTMDAFEVDVPRDIADIPKLSDLDEKLGFGLNAQLMRDENPYIRWTGYVMTENTVGHKGHAPGKVAASERAEMVLKASEAEFQRGVYSEYSGWLKENGKKGAWMNPEVRTEFMAKVTDHVEGHIADPAVHKTAAAFSRSLKNIHKMAQDAGVKGFDKFKSRPDYVPRIADPEAWQEAFAKFSEKQVMELIRKGIKRAQPDLDDALIGRMAKGYTKNVGKRSYEVGARSFDIGSGNREMLEELLNEMDLEAADVQNILTTVMGSAGKSDAGNHARAKHRTLMDLDATIDVVDRFDSSGQRTTLRLADLFERDAEKLLTTYARSVGGLAAIAQRTKGTSRHITSRADFDKLMDEARLWEVHNTRQKKSKTFGGGPVVEDKIGKADLIWKRVTGIPLYNQSSSFNRGRRLVMQWNFTRLMGKVAFAQFAEFGNMLAYAGWKEVMQQLPSIGKFMRRVRDTGELNHKLASELEAVLALGTDPLRNSSARVWDSGDRITKWGQVEQSIHTAQQIVAAPMHAITTLQQRMTVLALSQRMMNMVTGSRKMTKADTDRMNHLGLPEEIRERVFSQMKEHVTTNKGKLVKGARVKAMNFDSWTDQEAAQALQYAMFRLSRRIIQENDIGATAAWMHTPIGSIIAQFRTFTLVAHSKQLLNGLHHRDYQTTMAFMASMLFAGLGYTLRTYQTSVGREDQKEYLKKRLSAEAVAKASFVQSSWSTLLPMSIDSALYPTGIDPLFSYRSTGLQQNPVTGNPSFDLMFNKAPEAVTGVTQSLLHSDRDYSQKDFRNLKDALPTGNLPGVEQMLNAISSVLPKRS
ncbi:MAG: hypothetical protein KUF74_11460 [Candidatus Thiodiazotropha sp. (ex Ctena orbiculata)]|nr:hypothetical protein [Candidatus Thiodiazotropha taylori]